MKTKNILLGLLSTICFGLTSCGGNVIEVNTGKGSDETIVDALEGIITQVTEGLQFDFTKDKNGIVVTGYLGVSTEVFVPSRYNDLPVVEIAESAFRDCNMVRSITIGKNVVQIGERAFSGCSSLKTIVIPDGVTSIEYYTFYGCESLTDIEIPNTIESISYYAFYGCNSLQGNTYEDWIYLGNKRNKYVALFKPQNDNVQTCSMNEATKVICPAAFSNLSLKSVIVSDNVTSIGTIFSSTSVESIELGNKITVIDDEAFRNCALKSILIPNSVTSIGKYAFYQCHNLISITIPDSVTSIGHGAFLECTSLKTVTIPDSVKEFDYNTFNNDYYLETAVRTITIPCHLLFYISDLEPYLFDLILTNKNNSENVDADSYDIEQFTGLGSLTLPNGLTHIGFDLSALYYLHTITIPDSVTTVSAYAFENCSSLNTVYYTGTEEQWNSIVISEGNSYLTNANIIYNYKG